MYVFAYLRSNIKTRDFVMRLPIKELKLEPRKTKCVHIIKCAKVRHFLPKIQCVLHTRNNYAACTSKHEQRLLSVSAPSQKSGTATGCCSWAMLPIEVRGCSEGILSICVRPTPPTDVRRRVRFHSRLR